VFIETPFAIETDDCDPHFYGQRLAKALGPVAQTDGQRVARGLPAR